MGNFCGCFLNLDFPPAAAVAAAATADYLNYVAKAIPDKTRDEKHTLGSISSVKHIPHVCT